MVGDNNPVSRSALRVSTLSGSTPSDIKRCINDFKIYSKTKLGILEDKSEREDSNLGYYGEMCERFHIKNPMTTLYKIVKDIPWFANDTEYLNLASSFFNETGSNKKAYLEYVGMFQSLYSVVEKHIPGNTKDELVRIACVIGNVESVPNRAHGDWDRYFQSARTVADFLERGYTLGKKVQIL